MKKLTEEDQAKLDELNAAVVAAIKTRREWLDSKMTEYAEVQVGEPLYKLWDNQFVGIVTRHYRYWQDRDEGVRDRTLSIEYEYNPVGWPSNHFDNTSRQTGLFGRKR